ncbi:hypothetical protein DFJ58DRAFT_725700 [Suillus subalutaceus]|uniref:uncharacterized protein n=1 Tax=Suillus subalutaceus TaxID=48586 RepID=UPI001B873C79|nr:uncharacterized protein DFJ58DRAFT_725700 [Suillus subalutaceus]KAG1861519.1 hypothetical protein DFJ58DRAFT_725700 [Suillus subalutaceus]
MALRKKSTANKEKQEERAGRNTMFESQRDIRERKANPALQSQPMNKLAPQPVKRHSKPKTRVQFSPVMESKAGYQSHNERPVNISLHLAKPGPPDPHNVWLHLTTSDDNEGAKPDEDGDGNGECDDSDEDGDESVRPDGDDIDEDMRSDGEEHDINQTMMYDQEGSRANWDDEMNDQSQSSPDLDVTRPGTPEVDDPRLCKCRLTPEGYHTDADEEQRTHLLQDLARTNVGCHWLQPLTAMLSIDSPIVLGLMYHPSNHRQQDDRRVQSEEQPSNRHNRRSCAQSEAQPSDRRQHSDVLLRHQERNGRPRSPNLDYLQDLRQRGQDRIEEGEEDEEEQTEKDDHSDDDDEVQPATNNRKWSNGPIPTQLRSYPPVYKDLLEKAKKRSRLESLDNSFPHQLHDQFAAEGRGVEEGYWERHKHDMAIILWDDLGKMHSEFKKAAHPIVQSRYELFRQADECEYNDDAVEYIHNGIKELLDGGRFLRGRLDAQGRTDNLAHVALEISARYSVPKGAVALAATILAAALDKYKTGVWHTEKLHVNTYRPVHEGILNLMDQIESDCYHESKCRGFRRRWAKGC